VAADLKLHSSTRAEQEGKYVVCGKNMHALGLELHSQPTVVMVRPSERKKAVLSDMAPPPEMASTSQMSVLNTQKRDLRTCASPSPSSISSSLELDLSPNDGNNNNYAVGYLCDLI
jgi:hypothetical protein